MLARLAIRTLRDDIALTPGNNIGYHGPYTELLVRAGASRAIGEGCLAGVTVLGIEADGTVKGCPSLPAEHYAGGNIRIQRLSEMLARSEELAINLRARAVPRETLWDSVRPASSPIRVAADACGPRTRSLACQGTTRTATIERW